MCVDYLWPHANIADVETMRGGILLALVALAVACSSDPALRVVAGSEELSRGSTAELLKQAPERATAFSIEGVGSLALQEDQCVLELDRTGFRAFRYVGQCRSRRTSKAVCIDHAELRDDVASDAEKPSLLRVEGCFTYAQPAAAPSTWTPPPPARHCLPMSDDEDRRVAAVDALGDPVDVVAEVVDGEWRVCWFGQAGDELSLQYEIVFEDGTTSGGVFGRTTIE